MIICPKCGGAVDPLAAVTSADTKLRQLVTDLEALCTDAQVDGHGGLVRHVEIRAALRRVGSPWYTEGERK